MNRRIRLSAAVAATTLAVSGLLAVGGSPAGAATLDGDMLLNAVGTTYTHDFAVHRAVVAGGSTSFKIKVVNTGTDTTQFLVGLDGAPTGMTATLYDGSHPITAYQYATPLLKPGTSKMLTLKVSTQSTVVQSNYLTFMYLSDVYGHNLEAHGWAVDIAAPAHGASGYNLAAHNGSQPAVGGEVSYEVAASPAAKVGSSAKFIVRLQNDSAASVGMYLFAYAPGCPSGQDTFTAGRTNITADVHAGTYHVSIDAGAHLDITVAAKRTVADTCTSSTTMLQVQDNGHTVVRSVNLLLPYAV